MPEEMRVFGRRRAGPQTAGDGEAAFSGKVKGIDPTALTHLEGFVASRRGVEAYVEPATNFTQLTVVLVAFDGEWTRRRIGSERDAMDLGRRLGIPVYDVHATGYPTRMREWTRAQKAAEKAAQAGS